MKNTADMSFEADVTENQLGLPNMLPAGVVIGGLQNWVARRAVLALEQRDLAEWGKKGGLGSHSPDDNTGCHMLAESFGPHTREQKEMAAQDLQEGQEEGWLLPLHADLLSFYKTKLWTSGVSDDAWPLSNTKTV